MDSLRLVSFLCRSTLVFLLVVLAFSSCQELTDEDHALHSMLKANIEGLVKKPQPAKRGVRTYEVEKKKRDEEKERDRHPHPYYKEGILDDITYTYRKYREMILIRGAVFWMGTNFPGSLTGEHPPRQVAVRSFYLDVNPVINADYWAFRAKKRLVRSTAETKGWSWVVDMFLSEETREYYSTPGDKGWASVKRANWNAPEGPDSNLEGRWKHPVVHLSWHDAKSFCEFYGKRLPTEHEWEYAARAGLTNHDYPWGDTWQRRRANLWQGEWPHENRKSDGFGTTAPVDAYRPQNVIGLYDLIGNVWEWTASGYQQKYADPGMFSLNMVVVKGGSYVDSVLGDVNMPVRNGNRLGLKQDHTAANVGFRCAKSAPMHDPPAEDLVIPKMPRVKTTKKPAIRQQPEIGRPMFYRKHGIKEEL